MTEPRRAQRPAKPPKGWRKSREYLTVQEVMWLLRLKASQTYNALAAGQIPGGLKIGRMRRVKVSVFGPWLDAQGKGAA